MEFVHCHKCKFWPILHPEMNKGFFMTACGQLICLPCLTACGNKCPMGHASCKIMELNSQASSELKAYFVDPLPLLRDSLKKPLQIIQFQQALQREGLNIVKKLTYQMKSMNREMEVLKKENECLKQTSAELRSQVEDLTEKLNQQKNSRQSIVSNFSISPLMGCGMDENLDPLNLFPGNKPNAFVHPNLPHSQQSSSQSSNPFNICDSRNQSPLFKTKPPTNSADSMKSVGVSGPVLGPNNNQRRNQPTPTRQDQPAQNAYNFSDPRRTPLSSPDNFGTPASFSTNLSESPFPIHPIPPNGRRMSPTSPESRTPFLISRLRYLKCNPSPRTPN